MGPGRCRKDKVILALDPFFPFSPPPSLCHFFKYKILGVKTEILGTQRLKAFVYLRTRGTQKATYSKKKIYIHFLSNS